MCQTNNPKNSWMATRSESPLKSSRYEAILCYFWLFFYIFKQVSIYFSYSGECCLTVKLQKCFVDHKTSPDFPSAHNRLRLNHRFWVNCSFKLHNCFLKLCLYFNIKELQGKERKLTENHVSSSPHLVVCFTNPWMDWALINLYKYIRNYTKNATESMFYWWVEVKSPPLTFPLLLNSLWTVQKLNIDAAEPEITSEMSHFSFLLKPSTLCTMQPDCQQLKSKISGVCYANVALSRWPQTETKSSYRGQMGSLLSTSTPPDVFSFLFFSQMYSLQTQQILTQDVSLEAIYHKTYAVVLPRTYK